MMSQISLVKFLKPNTVSKKNISWLVTLNIFTNNILIDTVILNYRQLKVVLKNIVIIWC
jgi:hypothetical protein